MLQRSSKASTNIKNINHVSDDVLMVKYPSICQLVENHLEQKIQLLHAYVKWKTVESLFWQWMEQCLDEGIKLRDDEMVFPQAPNKSVKSNLMIYNKNISDVKMKMLEKKKECTVMESKIPARHTQAGIEHKFEIDQNLDNVFNRISLKHEPSLVPQSALSRKVAREDSMKLSTKTKEICENLRKKSSEVLNIKQEIDDRLSHVADQVMGGKVMFIKHHHF
uniref:Tubulin epsilon and delta complex protein 1 domain-containing protein n=2 Tax=Ciona intestinalis TaxID=7719 RepID=F6WMI9_CIOIN